ncbi:integrase core domain protein [Corynebacterium efficiens YS-314]|uniref:Putative transposase n=1 Tax=Corynebacterium efficiens (strain DSM 44549 / YS-314 / AJ 12310 / JCM 11189 / NBRC 100395) TaxID=196164 RepID=Q8FNN1_COREF|nr:IS21 family transposase [Corynebacterium efficiens]EEW49234.1 integrase core domain protein [Corynebacterium efficiens YS-314]BAC18923.1 putative transposase [Corynebacterium efficiens YS-314]
MANYKEIMALCLDGKSYSQITTVLGCSHRDIARVKAVIAQERIDPDCFRELSPGWFEDIFADGRRRRSQAYDQPDFKALAKKLKNNRHLTRNKLWLDYMSTSCAAGLAKYQYSQFCDGLLAYIQANDLRDVITHEPGQELYVDWAGDKISITDQATGEVAFKASLFIAVCPYSGLLFATATANEKMPAWIDCHVRALNYLGKVPAMIVPDNAPTATYRPKKNQSYRAVTARYADFAEFYDILIVPARPGKPRDKAAVERAVQIAYTRILGYFDGEVFYTLDELNDAIAERIEEINYVLTRPDGSTRRERFDTDEAPLMRDLPPESFSEVLWRSPKVDRNWHICCDYQYYSVPFQLVGKTLRARLTTTLVSVYDGDRLIAEHERMHGFRYRYSTNPDHGPDGVDTGHNVMTHDELVNWASSFGPATVMVITTILNVNSASVPRGLAQGRNILAKLGSKHDKATLEPACQVVVDKQLAVNFAVIKRVQADIAHNRPPTATSTTDGPRTVDISQFGDAVFIRPASHYASPGQED